MSWLRISDKKTIFYLLRGLKQEQKELQKELRQNMEQLMKSMRRLEEEQAKLLHAVEGLAEKTDREDKQNKFQEGIANILGYSWQEKGGEEE